MQSHLEQDGWKVRTAANGRLALDAVASEMPGLILLDLMMPEMDGFTFIEKFRKLPKAAHAVIVVTAKDLTAEDRARLNHSVERAQKSAARRRAARVDRRTGREGEAGDGVDLSGAGKRGGRGPWRVSCRAADT
jgi:DNA-binding response OmpR family regulator